MESPLLFALAVLTLLGTPGPTNTLLATAGAMSGMRRALPLIPAECAGYLVAVLVLGLVVGPLVAAAPVLGIALRLLVGAYLLAVAWRLWRRPAALVLRGAAVIRWRDVFVTTLLNPKAIVFAIGIIPFGSAMVGYYLLAFMGLIVLAATAWIAIGSSMGLAARAAGRGALVPRVGAAATATFACLVAFSPLIG